VFKGGIRRGVEAAALPAGPDIQLSPHQINNYDSALRPLKYPSRSPEWSAMPGHIDQTKAGQAQSVSLMIAAHTCQVLAVLCLDELRAFHLALKPAVAQREGMDPIALLSQSPTSDDLRAFQGRDDWSQVAWKDSFKSSRWPSWCSRHLHRFPLACTGPQSLPVSGLPVATSSSASRGGRSRPLR
jgi:hypothetical protein